MKQLDSYSPSETAVAGVTDYGQVVNEDSPGTQDGTPIDATLINDPYYAMYAVIKDAGVTPSGSVETTAVSDFLDALKIIVGRDAPDSFTDYFNYQYQEAAGVDGVALPAETWTKVPISVPLNQGIAGASVSAGVTTLPVGVYRAVFTSASWMAAGYNDRTCRVRVRGTSATLALGYSTKGATTNHQTPESVLAFGNGVFAITGAPQAVELQVWSALVGKIGGTTSASADGEVEVYGGLELWKIG